LEDVKVILENIIESNSEKNFMEGFKKLKNYSIILNQDIKIMNVNKMLEN
jgi:hypothetical protein